MPHRPDYGPNDPWSCLALCIAAYAAKDLLPESSSAEMWEWVGEAAEDARLQGIALWSSQAETAHMRSQPHKAWILRNAYNLYYDTNRMHVGKLEESGQLRGFSGYGELF